MIRAAGAEPSARAAGWAHRTDIQGLRAVAIALVVGFHLWPERLPGGFVGVDVFFVVSGFLITGHLLRDEPTGGRDLAVFWARRIRRLLPAALTVITAVLFVTWLFGPVSQWRKTGLQAVSSAVYLQNWQLAPSSTAAGDPHPTALQHYWSLSVEEQFYLLWPVLLLSCVLLARHRRCGLLPVARVAMGLVALGSIVFSMWFTQAHPASAYFVTPARMWELALGGLSAALVRPVRTARAPVLRGAAVWLGFAMIALAATTFHAARVPVALALLPVLGTAAVIAADVGRGPTPNSLLRLPPVQYLGDISYSVYLWHWPLIVLVPTVTGVPLTNRWKLAVVVGALALAALTKRQIEDRFRGGGPRFSLVAPFRWAAAGMAGVIALGGLEVVGANARTHASPGLVDTAPENLIAPGPGPAAEVLWA
ncbi:MAG TPA: acyltransferase [Sporichthyaceae bacterium]|jgi:peptidoglycan/LPS O-acetylase OafA/YrhL|nr:acyltransferase [Sporichthyaceae bacterium]